MEGNEKGTVYVVDIDHTLLNLINLMSQKLGVKQERFLTPTMEVEGINYQKILNNWNGIDSVYLDIIKSIKAYSFYEFRNYRMPQFFNEEVFNLIENELVVFVSSSFTRQGTELKSEVVKLYRGRLNGLTEPYIPMDLLTFADKSYEEYSYKNILLRLKLLGYQVVCVDDNVDRLMWADELGCEVLLVSQVWNADNIRFKRVSCRS